MMRILLPVLLLVAACGGDVAPIEVERQPLPEGATVMPSLDAHTAEFEKKIYSVTDTVHMAVGYGIANSILVEGDTCAFVVDVTESTEIATEVLSEFRKLTDMPIDTLIYTHSHADHVMGASIFAEGGSPHILAHEDTDKTVLDSINIIRPILSARAARMFGTYLEEGPEGLVNIGIGPFLGLSGPNGGTIGYMPPTETFSDRLEKNICGVEVVLEHAVGETDDQLFVWLPEQKILMPGDNVYRAFPNLYTIRGTTYRDVKKWSESVERMMALGAEHMVPSHTKPVSGADQIGSILLAYRDAIAFVHDQTVRGMNMQMTPDELVEFVRLPPHLADHPYLLEHYGTVEWSVRSVYSGYLGWYTGEGETLYPPKKADRAEALAAMASAETTLTAAAVTALEQQKYALAAELSDLALVRDDQDARARGVNEAALKALAFGSVSPNGRNFLLTLAGELTGEITVDETASSGATIEFARTVPLENYFSAMPVNLDAQKALDVMKVAEFYFSDTEQTFHIEVHRGVAFVREFPATSADIHVTTTKDAWIDLLLQVRSPTAVISSGDLTLEGGITKLPEFAAFMGLFG